MGSGKKVFKMEMYFILETEVQRGVNLVCRTETLHQHRGRRMPSLIQTCKTSITYHEISVFRVSYFILGVLHFAVCILLPQKE